MATSPTIKPSVPSLIERRMDEIDCARTAHAFIRENLAGAKLIRNDFGNKLGGIISAWDDDQLVCLSVVLRDFLNWSLVWCFASPAVVQMSGEQLSAYCIQLVNEAALPGEAVVFEEWQFKDFLDASQHSSVSIWWINNKVACMAITIDKGGNTQALFYRPAPAVI